jgi:hypothetical protein
VQTSSSLHGSVLFVYSQAPLLQASSVQGLPSSHGTPDPMQTPALHTSLVVQASPSSQGAVLSTN